MRLTVNQRLAVIAFSVLAFDQGTKWIVLRYLGYAQEKIILEGFFKFVHWGNTGAAWSMFTGHNNLLALVSVAALVALFVFKRHFSVHRLLGQLALGLMFGGIMGNLVDRVHAERRHVIDFLYFYVTRRDGSEIGFPAFNVADSAICVGVGLLFWLSWTGDAADPASNPEASDHSHAPP